MKKTIRDFDLNKKRVLIRCDFNVPIKNEIITDDNRIVESLPTIEYARSKGAKVILFSHLGKVKTEEDKGNKSLRVVSVRLSELLNCDVIFVPVTRGRELEDAISNMNYGDVLLVENTRFEDLNNKAESGNNPELGKYWASLGDIFINDAFGTSHRAHASNVGIASNLPSGIGFLIEKELSSLDVLKTPERPYYVILGGAKISDKIEIVSSLVTHADKILIGGGMAFTFLKAKGYEIGDSICENDKIDEAKAIMEKAKKQGVKIVLPQDTRVAKEFSNEAPDKLVDSDKIPEGYQGLDIGPKTFMTFSNELKDAKTILWNGPLGVCEFEKYTIGTEQVAEAIAQNKEAVSVVGGGDSVAAIKRLGLEKEFTHISTGGGASLELLEGKVLPGLACLTDKEEKTCEKCGNMNENKLQKEDIQK